MKARGGPLAPKALPSVGAMPDPTKTSTTKTKLKKFHIRQTLPASKFALYTMDELLHQANRYRDQLCYDQAIECYQDMLKREPMRPDLYRYIAECYDFIGCHDDAFIQYAIAEDLRQRFTEASPAATASAKRVALPPAHSFPAAGAGAGSGWNTVGKGIKNLKKSLQEARALSDGGDFFAAEEAYRRLRDAAPDSSEVLLGLGWCLHKQKRHTEAASEFERSLLLDRNPLGYQGLIQCKIYLKDLESALDLACECLDDFPWSRTIIALKNTLEDQLGITRNTMVQVAPGFEEATPRLAMTLSAFLPPELTKRGGAFTTTAHRKHDDAISSTSFTQKPKTGSSWDASTAGAGAGSSSTPLTPWLAVAKAGAAALPPPAPITKRAIPTKPITQEEIEHARALSTAGDPTSALVAFEQLRTRAPHHPDLLCGSAWSLHLLKRNKEAIPLFEANIAQGASAQTYLGLARCYRYTGDLTSALQYANEGERHFSGYGKLALLKVELQRMMAKTATVVYGRSGPKPKTRHTMAPQ